MCTFFVEEPHSLANISCLHWANSSGFICVYLVAVGVIHQPTRSPVSDINPLFSGKVPEKIDKGGTARIFMVEEDAWRVADLLDAGQPFVKDVALARQMVETLSALDSLERKTFDNGMMDMGIVSLNVRTPKAALEYVENTLSEWFETVAEIEKRRGNLPYLIDRSLYPSGEIDWNQGLKKSDLDDWLTEIHGPGITDYPYRKARESSDEPLSGYYNRLLPVKFVLRMLAALTLNCESFDKDIGWDLETDESVQLSELRESSWQTASYAKESLQLFDKFFEGKGKTGAKISVGFPRKEEKSKERFVSQFVGSRRKNDLSGALFDMGFANMPTFLGMSTEEVFFTPFGWGFAMLENPIIDETEGWESGGKFAEEEVNYLLAHFKQNLPAEWEFMVSIAQMISGGINDATKMNAELISKRDWNRSKASVYRTGVLARMQELGLVDREKSGVEVTFVLTESGKDKLL